jgi:hypothetical protein
MEQVGYSLIDSNQKEIQHWGETGSFTTMPEVLWLPNGDIVNAPVLYVNFSGYQLVKRLVENNPPSPFFSPVEIVKSFKNDDILLTYYYGNKPNITPPNVSALQMRKALNQLNKRTLFDDYYKNLEQDFKDVWDYASILNRQDDIFKKIVSDKKITDDDLDDIFRLASTL